MNGGKYAGYDKLCTLDEKNSYYEVLHFFSVVLADGTRVEVEGCVLRRLAANETTLARTIPFLKEIGCKIDPNVATNACYEGALFDLMRKRKYSVHFQGIHAEPGNCLRTTIVENFIGVERTGGGSVVAAFTYEHRNILFKTDMIGMFKRVEVIINARHDKRLTLGELYKLIDEDLPAIFVYNHFDAFEHVNHVRFKQNVCISIRERCDDASTTSSLQADNVFDDGRFFAVFLLAWIPSRYTE